MDQQNEPKVTPATVSQHDAAPPQAAVSADGDQYEFNEPEERVIGRTGRWAGHWSWVALILGLLFAVIGIATLPNGFGSLALGSVFILIGFYFRGAAASLKSVVTTSGSDLLHLMTAMDRLTRALKAQAILILLALASGLLWGVFVVSDTGVAP